MDCINEPFPLSSRVFLEISRRQATSSWKVSLCYSCFRAVNLNVGALYNLPQQE